MKLTISVGTLILVGVLMVPAFATMNKVGTSGALFLKIGMDPRTVAMGEAGSSRVGDAASVFANPAGLAAIEGNQLFISDTEWIADIRFIGGAYAFEFSDYGVFALSAVAVDYGSMPMVREAEADVVVETFSPKDVAVQVSYATAWTDRLLVGGTMKYISQSITDYKSTGIAFDFGTVYYTGFNTLRLAMATSNFGPDMKFDGSYTDRYYIGTAYVEKEKAFSQYGLPLTFRIGVAYDFALTPTSRLTAAVDGTHLSDYSERLHLGFEYAWSEMLFLRTGYTTNAEEMGVSAGCGLGVNTGMGKAMLDYAFTDFGVFAGVHRFSLGLDF
jgi:hypothetical protein